MFSEPFDLKMFFFLLNYGVRRNVSRLGYFFQQPARTYSVFVAFVSLMTYLRMLTKHVKVQFNIVHQSLFSKKKSTFIYFAVARIAASGLSLTELNTGHTGSPEKIFVFALGQIISFRFLKL